ncbi:ATP synthase membrane subunit K, mitochondrial [Cloeon dipterum]|uniref:ATP synthase membrane subunit K, mitochondrial n=1 Tax=Cloeon dipterum TaxID=197152 RepID=UPI00321FAC1B
MAGAAVEDSQFKGLSKIFNSTTMKGRANVGKATYGVVGLIILYNMVKPSKKPAAAK